MTETAIDYAALESLEKAATPPLSDELRLPKGGGWCILGVCSGWNADDGRYFLAIRNAAPALIAKAKAHDEAFVRGRLAGLKETLDSVDHTHAYPVPDIARHIRARIAELTEKT